MPVTAVTKESASITWALPGPGNSASVRPVSLETTAKKVWVCGISEISVYRVWVKMNALMLLSI